LILATAALSRHCTACRIDKGPRGLERPSDHAPVVAEFSGV
jgi:exodeoxyribonuclease III